MDPSKNIIITGIPRSGTSLLTTLIDSAPNAVALHEPYWQANHAFGQSSSNAKEYVCYLIDDYQRIRTELLAGNTILDRRNHDKPVTNYYTRQSDGSIRNNYQLLPLPQKPLQANFTLAMKHCGLYLGILDELAACGKFTLLGIYREKNSVLSSWRSLPNIPPHNAALPGGEIHDSQYGTIRNSSYSLHKKQEVLYDYMLKKMKDTDTLKLIPYEALINTINFEALTGLPLSVDLSHIKKGA